ncbi:MAG TPA: Gfo/Idh/MocA family oxidoreductase [Planctomycetaceae bacterium]|jgi:predicted dehydrogenase|nr:Gfo/Idh/MocA family oxidoreductase [Planctomycetaceae bacterium]
MIRETTRRDFMKQTAAMSAAVWVSASSVRGASRSANEKLNIAAIGAGGKGRVDIAGCSHENIVALCDADDERAAETYKKYPNVPKYKDYRKMLEERKDIDAVIVSTPDHHHAPASVLAMRMGKHVYCQKPLTHSIYESRRMREVAREMNVVTQMGNQGHAFDGARRIVELIRDGAIGQVREVHCWTDRPGKYWHQPVERPQVSDPVPNGLDWDLWLGAAPERPYGHRGVYCPHNWRAWWDFGSGALGDMACHVVDPAFWALELGAPASAEATAEGTTPESAPAWQIIHYNFPEREAKANSHWKLPRKLPAVTLTWYDSGKKPRQELGDGKKLSSSGTIFVGDKGRLYSPSEYGLRHILLPQEKFLDYKEPDPYLPRNPRSQNAPYIEWIAGCKGGPMSLSNFDYASRLTEAMLVGVLAVRLGKKIEWDSDKMQATNAPEAAPIIKREYRRGWTV